MNWKSINGGVLAPGGFSGGTVNCGIKSPEVTRDDLALVSSDYPCVAVGTFTKNRVQAAPVLVSKEHLRGRKHRAVVLNSGNANACTGEDGMEHARLMAQATARRLGVSEREVLVCSTGRIGIPLPIERIVEGIGAVELSSATGEKCARAIMTSDTFPKHLSLQVKAQQGSYKVGAMAKGAGMIDPNMATMLCVVTTDAKITRSELRRATRAAVESSFNRITVDGDMSTNDTVLVLANGASEVEIVAEDLVPVLVGMLKKLARQIVADGEGATRVIDVRIRGARTEAEARKAAEAVANSQLVKTSWAGSDPNWGRLMDAIGYSGARFDANRVSIRYEGVLAVRDGQDAGTSVRKLQSIASRKEFAITIDLCAGSSGYEVWTTDLTAAYVDFNLTE